MAKKEVILFTDMFPYGYGEQFLETEILLLANSMDRVIVYPFKVEGPVRALPENVEVVDFIKDQPFSVRKLFLKNLFTVFNVFSKEWSKRKKYRIRGVKFHFNNFMLDLHYAQELQKHLEANYHHPPILYSYWFGQWGNVLAITNKISAGKFTFITRIHGYDFNVERRENGFIPFRNFQMRRVRKVVSVSQFGANVVANEYAKLKHIVDVSRLGVLHRGDAPTMRISDEWHIVSCSSLIPLKRVHLIAQIISHLPGKIRWTHFGDGKEKEKVMDYCKDLPSSVTVDLKGHVSNQEVIDFYGSNYVDVFINASEFEGIPVSIMEAISFGIPVIGCRICGVPEIVTDQTGILLEKEFHPEKAAQRLASFLSRSDDEITLFRKGVKSFWMNNYNAEKNYQQFIQTYLLNK